MLLGNVGYQLGAYLKFLSIFNFFLPVSKGSFGLNQHFNFISTSISGKNILMITVQFENLSHGANILSHLHREQWSAEIWNLDWKIRSGTFRNLQNYI